MKTDKYQRRFYRDWISAGDLYLCRVVVKETDLQILTDKPVDKNFLKETVSKLRGDIEKYIARDRKFLTSLKPLEVELTAPFIVKEMGRTAKSAGVGPMAAVAGAISQFLGKALLRRGFKDVIIENGGDIFLKSRKIRKVGIYAGRHTFWRGLSMKVKPENTPIGICASSGTVGHSLSFGCADSVVILSKNALLADAVATATCNRVGSRDDVKRSLDFARSIKGVSGVLILLHNNLATWGEVELVR